mgnify:FL=1
MDALTLDDVERLVDPTADDLDDALRPMVRPAEGGRLPSGWVSVVKSLTGASAADAVVAWSRLRSPKD